MLKPPILSFLSGLVKEVSFFCQRMSTSNIAVCDHGCNRPNIAVTEGLLTSFPNWCVMLNITILKVESWWHMSNTSACQRCPDWEMPERNDPKTMRRLHLDKWHDEQGSCASATNTWNWNYLQRIWPEKWPKNGQRTFPFFWALL